MVYLSNNFVLNFLNDRKWYGHENRKTQNTLKSGKAKHMFGRTTVKSGTALAVLAALVAPHLRPHEMKCNILLTRHPILILNLVEFSCCIIAIKKRPFLFLF